MYPSLLPFSGCLFSISCHLWLTFWQPYSSVANRDADGEHDICKNGIHNYCILQTLLQNCFSNYNSSLLCFLIFFTWHCMQWCTLFLWLYQLMFLLLPLFVKSFKILFCTELEMSFCFLQSAWGFRSTVCYSTDFTCSFRLLYLRLMRHSFSVKKLFKSTLSCIDKLITTIKCLYMFRNDCWLSPLSTLSLIKDCRGENNQLLAAYFY